MEYYNTTTKRFRAYLNDAWESGGLEFGPDLGMYGFTNQTDTSISFNDVTYTFTLTDAGSGWTYYRQGILCRITGNKTVVLPGTPPDAGLYFIFIDADDGTLSASTSAWTLVDAKIPVALIAWNNTLTPKYWIADERHQSIIQRRVHWYLHSTRGTQLLTGGVPSGYVVPGGSPVGDGDNTFGIEQTEMADEDIRLVLSSLADPSGAVDAYTLMYRTGASTWAWERAQVPFRYTTAGYIQWDNAGTMTEGTNNKFYNWYLMYANFAGDGRYLMIPGRGEFASASAAYAENYAAFSFTGLPIKEGILAYQFTFNAGTSYPTKGKVKLTRDPQRIIASLASVAVSGGATDHNTLSGLQGGAIGEYYHLTNTQSSGLTGGTVTTLHKHTSLEDADSDTKIQTEASADEDVVRIATAGTERVTIDSAGRMVVNSSPDTDYRKGVFSADGLMHAPLFGGTYVGRTKLTESPWSVQNIGEVLNAVGTTQAWQAVAMSSDGKYQTAVVYGGTIYTSSDYGLTWTSVESSRNWIAVAMSSDGWFQAAAVDGSYIYISSDYGANWSTAGTEESWTSIAMSADGRVILGGRDTDLLVVSGNHGDTWTEVASSKDWRSVAASSDGKYLAAAAYGDKIYVSVDYGATWTGVGSTGNFTSVAMSADGRTLLTVNSGGKILISDSQGLLWSQHDSNRSWDLVAMTPDAMVMLAAVNGAALYISTDKGGTWTTLAASGAWTGIAISADGSVLTIAEDSTQLSVSYAVSRTLNCVSIGDGVDPVQQLTIHGRDESAEWEQTNGLLICGEDGSDKEICWADHEEAVLTKRWSHYTWRGEGGEFLYNYNFMADKDVMVMSEGGRTGFNKQSNILNYHAVWMYPTTGALDDLVVGGEFTKPYQIMYEIDINVVSTPDQFRWRKSTDYGTTWGSYSSDINCSATPYELENGVTVAFGATTGHNTNDTWRFIAFPQLPQGIFTVSPSFFDEVIQTSDYTAGSPTWDDITYSCGTNWAPSRDLLLSGTTSATMFARSSAFNGIYVNVTTAAIGATLVVEYWSGSSYTTMSSGSHDLSDGTNNLTTSGYIRWDKALLTGWVPNTPAGYDEEYYWIRIRSSTNVTTAPEAILVTPGTDTRFAVYAAHFDPAPVFKITSAGHTELLGELKIKVYEASSEPLLQADQRLAMWHDSLSDRVYLVFRKTGGSQVRVELV